MFFLAAFFDNVWNRLHGGITLWTVFGLTGNVLFTSRFIVQWYVSERLKQSVIPKNFWHLSLVGGVIQLIYALHIGAVPLILGFLLPPVIAARNLMLIARHSRGDPPGPPDAPRPDDGSAAPTAADPDRMMKTTGWQGRRIEASQSKQRSCRLSPGRDGSPSRSQTVWSGKDAVLRCRSFFQTKFGNGSESHPYQGWTRRLGATQILR